MSELRVDSIKNRTGNGAPVFTGTITAGGFRVSGQSGFLKADGSIDTNTYLSGSGSIGSGNLTLAVSGTGIEVSTNPVFNANATANKTITLTLSSSSASTPNSLVSRDGSSNTAVNQLTATTLSTSTLDSITTKVTDRILCYSTSAGANETPITSYFTTPALVGDSCAQFGIGIQCLIGSANNNPAVLEFYKNRNSNLSTHTAVLADDGIGALHFSGSDGVGPELTASLIVNATSNWTNTFHPSCFRFIHNADVGGSSHTYRETLMIGKTLSSGDTVGSSTLYIPYAPTSASSANAVFDANNRLVRASSSLKYKTNIEDIEDKYAYNILNLRPVWYKSKTNVDNEKWSWYGLIAEEVAEVEPRLAIWAYSDSAYDIVVNDSGVEEKHLKDDAQLTPEGVQYDRIAVLLLKLVKDQQKRIEELEIKIESLMK